MDRTKYIGMDVHQEAIVPGQAKLDRKGGIDKVEFLAHRRD